MKKMFVFLGFLVFSVVGCATVKLQTPAEPIKLDVTMRLDVYQHVQKDIDAIESIVTGGQPEGLISLFDALVPTAYAEDLSPEIENAALRRKARYSQIVELGKAGVIGENSLGMAVVRKAADASAEKLVKEENNDRMVIYEGIARKNGTSVTDVQKVYAKSLQNSAPAGTPIEMENGAWRIK